MNGRQLQKIGVPERCVKEAVLAVQQVSRSDLNQRRNIKTLIKAVLAQPEVYLSDKIFGGFAAETNKGGLIRGYQLKGRS